MADSTHEPNAKPPRRALGRGIVKGSLIGAALGLMAAAILVFALSAVRADEPLALQAMLYLALEAGFAGAIIGALLAGLHRLRNTR